MKRKQPKKSVEHELINALQELRDALREKRMDWAPPPSFKPSPFYMTRPYSPCAHDACPNCHGTGIGITGPCIHALVCTCPKCSPTCGAPNA